MMQGQVEVLQGKQRAMQRFYERLGQILPTLAEQASPLARACSAPGTAGLLPEPAPWRTHRRRRVT